MIFLETAKPQKKETKKVDLFGGEDEDGEEGDLFSGNSVATTQPEQKKKKVISFCLLSSLDESGCQSSRHYCLLPSWVLI